MARGELGNPSRRSLFKRIAGASAAVAGSSALGAVGANEARADALHREALVDPSVQAFLGPIAPGAMVGDRWQVEAVRGVRFGSLSVVLSTREGAHFQVDVLRRDDVPGAARGVGESRSLATYVSNRGDGSTATHEEMGLGAMALADELQARESAGASVPALLTMLQRSVRFPDGALAVLRG